MKAVTGWFALCLVGLWCSLAEGDNYFDGRIHDPSGGVWGSRASISTAPIPDLHGGEVSCVWAMVCRDDLTRWAQTGYALFEGKTTLCVFAQWKVSASTKARTITKIPPAPGAGPHTYECLQDGPTWVWSFKYDGVQWGHSTATDWRGQQARFFGEVIPSKTVQMMGDASHKVKFTNFRIFRPPCSGWPTIWPEEPVNQAPEQWGHEASQAGGYFKIWDNTP